ncbi:hypothetical protein [Haliangium ochraceum]|uniref:Uncharacterized protein n=1 Tax=Haliangium ochraceum (strain DSM 14365 / JCM 11303 / SMP-2) TaxID=502025 RepID=D0LXB0_HALO1|nr:hypothetical protein [Haliangium ochraceum]ACY16152.1 hypothetical protein Hoch_3650 [Haliangium ochraceum DSM 14365]
MSKKKRRRKRKRTRLRESSASANPGAGSQPADPAATSPTDASAEGDAPGPRSPAEQPEPAAESATAETDEAGTEEGTEKESAPAEAEAEADAEADSEPTNADASAETEELAEDAGDAGDADERADAETANAGASAPPPRRRRWFWRRPREARVPPRWSALKGFGTGLLAAPVALTLAILGLAHLGVGTPRGSLLYVLAVTAAFTALPAALTWSGIGRVAARRVVAPRGSLEKAIRMAQLSGAVAGAGLIFLAAIPLQALTTQRADYGWFALAGAVAGAIVGALAGGWAAWPNRRRRASPTS